MLQLLTLAPSPHGCRPPRKASSAFPRVYARIVAAGVVRFVPDGGLVLLTLASQNQSQLLGPSFVVGRPTVADTVGVVARPRIEACICPTVRVWAQALLPAAA